MPARATHSRRRGDHREHLHHVCTHVLFVHHRSPGFCNSSPTTARKVPVGQFYHDFLPTSDHDVEDLLVAAAERLQAGPRVSAVPPRDREVLIPTEQGQLPGRLVVPAGARAGLGLVTAPTLLVVGGHDPRVLELNRRAAAMLRCKNRLSVVRGCHPLVRGARNPAGGRRAGRLVVRRPSRCPQCVEPSRDVAMIQGRALASVRGAADPPTVGIRTKKSSIGSTSMSVMSNHEALETLDSVDADQIDKLAWEPCPGAPACTRRRSGGWETSWKP